VLQGTGWEAGRQGAGLPELRECLIRLILQGVQHDPNALYREDRFMWIASLSVRVA